MPGNRVRLRPPEHKPLCRASTIFLTTVSRKDVDGRDKPGHDKVRELSCALFNGHAMGLAVALQ